VICKMITKKQKQMKGADKEKIMELKRKFGKHWKKKVLVRKNYPFGKHSTPMITLEKRRIK